MRVTGALLLFAIKPCGFTKGTQKYVEKRPLCVRKKQETYHQLASNTF